MFSVRFMILSNAGLFLSVERRNTEVFISSSSIFMYRKHTEKEEERERYRFKSESDKF